MLACFCAVQATAQIPPDRSTSNSEHTGRVRVSEILITTPQPYDPQQVAEAKSKAEGIGSALRRGHSFVDLAKKYSQGPSATLGGDLGYFCSGHLAQALDDLVFQLKV